MNHLHPRIKLSGIVVDLMDQSEAVQHIINHASDPQDSALSVVSANLDHIVQFGHGSRWDGSIGHSLNPTFPLRDTDTLQDPKAMSWLTLLDGAPLVKRSRQLTGRQWPRLAGSDLIGPILDEAESKKLSVGFLGGSPHVQQQLAHQLAEQRPDLEVTGFWAPDRKDLQDHEYSVSLATQIKDSKTDILVVGLGKPRQELWMASYGSSTGAKVLLAFGAVVDFLAGAVKRAPSWVALNGMEWAWRLALEPKRLSQRYLLHNPLGLAMIRQDGSMLAASGPVPMPTNYAVAPVRGLKAFGRFVGPDAHADVTVLAVTYNNADSVEALIASLREQALTLDLRVIVADNGSTDETVAMLGTYPDVICVPTGANLGYAGGINHIRGLSGDCDAVLVLNPDLTVNPGAISAMLRRMQLSGAGIVVPRLLQPNGETYVSLRREPTITRAVGDAFFGERFSQRPGWASEIDFDRESYEHPHRVEWATGAAVMVERRLHELLGAWDEQFFLYSEETDYFRRAREEGAQCWYEPKAVMMHQMGGSGSSTALNALMAVNRVKYVRKHHSARFAQLYLQIVRLHELLRITRPAHRGIYRIVANERLWDSLPAAETDSVELGHFPFGSIIIPAHNESDVIRQTLMPLAELAELNLVKVVVACNGCTDNTAQIARSFKGVEVLETEVPSKVFALNLAEEAAGDCFPRLYLDADIVITPSALRTTFEHLGAEATLSARPAFEYDSKNASPLVRSFYRARRRIPSTSTALWGAGAYALSRNGRSRFAEFPSLTADDLYIDELFSAEEKAILPTIPVRVQTPRNVSSLLRVLTRNYRGQREAKKDKDVRNESSRRTLSELVSSVSGFQSLGDACTYASLVLIARRRAKALEATVAPLWERDDSSRTQAQSIDKQGT
ncbi:WecB/TagA/CpsF family glycosyltransferase [Arthrobacter sp. YC-RL1]|uniref:WecB/TagA/CpsF family glycosyltransferase n=1 Tax=Arthrobacter sp. YC-RL1 TaxID=1652545 RepID=UPI0009E5788A|nr:WecB/TagA/CpsF family glycosyltransferase [Arthrobacter sp. YC-RL1]